MNLKQLNETPIIIETNRNKMMQYLTKYFNENNISGIENFKKTNMSNIYLYESPFESLYVHFTKQDGITAFMFFTQDGIKHNNKSYGVIKQGNTCNIKNIYKNFTLKIFKEVSKSFNNRPVLIDSKNSNEMIGIFNKWLDHPEKYGITDWFIYDFKLMKTISTEELKFDVWEEFERAKRYSIVFDFNNILKNPPDFDIESFNESLKGTRLYFDKEAYEAKKLKN